jgi:hypothetical protein
VEVPPEVVERVEGAAETVVLAPEDEIAGQGAPETPENGSGEASPIIVIDRPNTPAIIRKVLHRDGRVCSNPCCRRKLDLQSHHLKERGKGGKTAPWNEAGLCATCHALYHAGYLSVTPDREGELVWRTRANDLPGIAGVARELGSMTRVRLLEVTSARGEVTSARGEVTSARGEVQGAGGVSRMGPDEETEEMREDIVCALVGLGYSQKAATLRVDRALAAFRERNQKPSEEELLRETQRQRAG